MNTGTYGLGTSGRGPASIGSGGLAGMGSDQNRTATNILGSVAEQETRRNIANERLAQEEKAGGSQLGGALGGAAGGAAFGPWGALAGGLIGAIAGKSLF